MWQLATCFKLKVLHWEELLDFCLAYMCNKSIHHRGKLPPCRHGSLLLSRNSLLTSLSFNEAARLNVMAGLILINCLITISLARLGQCLRILLISDCWLVCCKITHVDESFLGTLLCLKSISSQDGLITLLKTFRRQVLL